MDQDFKEANNKQQASKKTYKVHFGSQPGRGKGQFREWIQQLQRKMDQRMSGRKGWNPLVILALTLVLMFLYFFLRLPALNPQAPEFYRFLILGVVVFNVLNLWRGRMPLLRIGRVSLGILGVLVVVPLVLGLLSQPIFRAKTYAKLIPVEDANFSDTVKQMRYNKVPVVDRDAAEIIGNRQLGAIKDVVSQFNISDNYTQINVKNVPVRVTPLAYSDIIKYVLNNKNGIPYYVQVDMATQEASLIKLNKPLKYSTSDILMRDIQRHLRFQYPFQIFGETNFEVDDQGQGFFITSVLTRRIGFFGGTDVKGAIVTDASSGASTYYSVDKVPDWVDRVYPAELIVEQLNYRGMLSGGFFNSIIGQRNVTKTTDGYNYVPLDDDIFTVKSKILCKSS
ncbi:hypothetical protein ABB02_01931 [Clostridiaceae bacterium JG1575]|nr:hypothetical protein ABB02_01931 [Clostridiaceae bacterium JG1575]